MNFSFFKKIASVCAIVFFVGFPGILFAQDTAVPTNYIPLTPLPGISEPGKNTVELATYLPGIYKLAIASAGVLAVIMIVFGGFEYITSASLGGKSDGRAKITNALIGLLLAFGAYMILYTINPDTVEFNLSIQRPTEYGREKQEDKPAPPGRETGQDWPSDSITRAYIKNSNININNDNLPCLKIGDSNCTSVYGLSDSIIAKLDILNKDCHCKITITGGTEYWAHSLGTQHKPGGNVVDLRLDSGLISFLKSKGKKPTKACATTGAERYEYDGVVYVNETKADGTPPRGGSHFHACF